MSVADRFRGLELVPAAGALPAAAVDAPEAVKPAGVSAIPRPRQLRPDRPPRLSIPADVIWHQVVDELEYLGILERIDQGALVRYCEYRAEWDRLTAIIQDKGTEGYVMTHPTGAVQVSAWMSARKQIEQGIHSLETELGLTPASRARLMFATYGGRPLAIPKAGRPGLRGSYNKGAK